jgi:hypothetical protein
MANLVARGLISAADAPSASGSKGAGGGLAG